MGDQSFPPCAQEVSEGRDQITYQGANLGGLDLTVLDRNRLSEPNFTRSKKTNSEFFTFEVWITTKNQFNHGVYGKASEG